MVPVMRMDRGSVERVRQAMRAKARRGFNAMSVTGQKMCVQTVQLARRNFPVATGESRGKVHTYNGVRTGNRFRTGLGVGRTANEQAVRMERGGVNVHTSLEAHDPGGKKCSSGWQQDEPDDVRSRFGELRVNPNAMNRPVYHAILARMGPVVSSESGKNFKKGQRNMFTRNRQGNVFGSRLFRVLKLAARLAISAVVMLFVGSVMGQGVLNSWDIAEKPLVMTDSVLVPGVVMSSPVIEITHSSGSPQFFTAYVKFIGYGASMGLPSVSVYMTSYTDERAHVIEWDKATGDTMWVLSAYADTNWVGFRCDPPGGRFMKVNFVNAGDTVEIDTLRLWMKH